MNEPTTDFYVGYLPKPPERLARFLCMIVAALAVLCVVAALVLVIGQRPFAASFFEFGNVHTFEGTLIAQPYPTLFVARPGKVGDAVPFSSYLLVAPGKHGAGPLTSAFDGKIVQLKGQLIYRDGNTMVEVEPGSITTTGVQGMGPNEVKDLGTATLSGEIVDSKCYLGVMNPGNGKVHRDCAARCISGGIPPVFIPSDGSQTLLLVDNRSRPLSGDALREFIAEPLTVTGRLIQSGGQTFLQLDPTTLRHIR